ncbi:MAG: signal peptide peptidase SppA [Dehalococcoidia bacterium]|nr:signal peptide peptidase SppA [Dehalococcoidia bacterium]
MKHSRKFIIRIVSVLLLAILILPVGCVSVPGRSGNKIAVISLNGPITSGSGSLLSSTVITPDVVRDQLHRVEKDAAVKAIVLRIDSPGGEVEPCQEISYALAQVKQSIPVVVSMRSMAASGGYYISADADAIVALPSTLTGSIGVISQIPNLEGLYDKLGIQMQVFTGGEHKDMYSGLRELTPEEKQIMQDMTDEYYEQFISVVAEGRGMSETEVKSLATGQLYSGTDAKSLGLIDYLGGLDTALDVAANLASVENFTVEYYQPKSTSLLSSLLGINLKALANTVQMRLLGMSGEDILALQALSTTYPRPQYLCSS